MRFCDLSASAATATRCFRTAPSSSANKNKTIFHARPGFAMCTALREIFLAQAPCRPLPTATLDDTVPLKTAQKGIISDNALNDNSGKLIFISIAVQSRQRHMCQQYEFESTMRQLAAFPKGQLATGSRHIMLSLDTCLQWRPSQPSVHAFLKNEYIIIALA